MKINNENLEMFLKESLNSCSNEFDEFEEKCEFSEGDYTYTCPKVNTTDFCVKVKDYSMEIIEDSGLVIISGNAEADYTVTGFDFEGDEEAGGYIECGKVDNTAGLTFSIDVNLTDFEESDLEIEII